MPMGWAVSWGIGFEAAPQTRPVVPSLQEWEPHRGMPEPYLEGSAVRGCQLPLVVEHLLKVRDMPVLVSGVAVKPLQRPRGHVSTPHLLGMTGAYPQGFTPT